MRSLSKTVLINSHMRSKLSFTFIIYLAGLIFIIILYSLYLAGFIFIIYMYYYSGAIESVLTDGNISNQDCKALQRVVRLAERISGSALPSLQDIYLKCCKSSAAKITKDSNHPGKRLLILLPSGKRFHSMMAKTERLRSFFPQAIRLLNSNPVS